jgi:hypothetical protein
MPGRVRQGALQKEVRMFVASLDRFWFVVVTQIFPNDSINETAAGCLPKVGNAGRCI